VLIHLNKILKRVRKKKVFHLGVGLNQSHLAKKYSQIMEVLIGDIVNYLPMVEMISKFLTKFT
jgi:hypothetical protein